MLKFILLLSSWMIWVIKKLSGANITVSGEKLPEGSLLFMANHFTRFETFLVPYVLFSSQKRISRSLADDAVFVGWLGEYMKLAGTVSSQNKARDCIILNDLLTSKADWVIYPEGKMVKNKAIVVEEEQFVMNCPVCKVEHQKEPLHTGAALLALKAEILRQQMSEGWSETELEHCCEEYCLEKNTLIMILLFVIYNQKLFQIRL